MLATATIAYDIADLVGNDFDARRTKIWVSTNVDSGVISDTVGNQVRIGDGLGTIADDGTGSVSVWVPGTGSNPTTWQTYIHFDYAQRRPGGARERLTFGPFTVTTSANLADLIQEQEIPPTYLSTVTELLQVYVDEAEQARDDAVAIAAGSLLQTFDRRDPLVSTITRDSAGRPTVVVQDGITTTLSRDSVGRPASYSTSDGVSRTITRDASGRIVSVA